MSDETTEPEVPAFGLEDAKQLIERMKLARIECYDTCIRVGYQAASGAFVYTHGGWTAEHVFHDVVAVHDWMKTQKFEQATHQAGFLKRCPACAATPMFPWADKLDPQRVLNFVLVDPRCESAFELSILEDTLRHQVEQVEMLPPELMETVNG